MGGLCKLPSHFWILEWLRQFGQVEDSKFKNKASKLHTYHQIRKEFSPNTDCFNFFIFVNGQSRWWHRIGMSNLHRSGTILMCLSTVKFHPTNLSINKLQLSTSKRTGNSNLNKSYFSPPWMWAACCIRLGIPWVNGITLDIFNSINR